MGLDPDRIDRGSGALHPLEQIEQRRAARFLLWGIELDIVFVDDEARGRIGFPRRPVCEVEILRSEHLEEYRGPKTVRPAILGLDRLVDDVPAVHHSPIAAGQRPYPLDDRGLDLLAA